MGRSSVRRGASAACVIALLAVVMVTGGCTGPVGSDPTPSASPQPVAASVALPEPTTDGAMSLERALATRRSVRALTEGALSLQEVSQLLWAAQGTTSAAGGRTAPSAGALYPLEVLLVSGAVEGLEPGVYRYLSADHALALTRTGDARPQLREAALGQEVVARGSISIVLVGVPERTTTKYGDRGVRFVAMEAGHAAQNVYLQATALGLGTVSLGAFDDAALSSVLDLPPGWAPLYVLPVGRPA